MSEHRIKVKAPYFAALLDGTKTFEVRRNDRAYQCGDTLVLVPVDEEGYDYCGEVTRTITFVYSGDPRFDGHGGLQPGYVVLGLGGASGSATGEQGEAL